MATNKKKKNQQRSNGKVILLLVVLLVGAILAGVLVPDPTGSTRAGAEYDTAITAHSPVQFSEVMSANASTMIRTDGVLSDWIELVNTGSSDVALTGFALMPEGDPTKLYRFPNMTIPAGGYIVMHADGTNASVAGELHLPFRLSSAGETLALLNAAGQVVDSVDLPHLEADQVYCRDGSGAWQMSIVSTAGMPNQVVTESGESVQAASVTNVVSASVGIVEIMARNATYSPDENGEYHDYVELYNSSAEPVSLKDWYLSDDRTNITMWQFPDVTIPSGGSVLVYCSGYDRRNDPTRLHTGFRISGDGATVLLTQPDGQTVSVVEVPVLETDQAYSCVNNLWTGNFPPTPGALNSVGNANAIAEQIRARNAKNVIVSEISASSTTVNSDWIEIYNAGSEPVDLSGYGLSDNAARPRKWQFPAGSVIQPGQYVGVLCSGLDKNESGQLHTNFALSADGGYSVTLSQPDGNIIDRVFVPQQYVDVSYGRVEGQQGFYFFTLTTPLAKNDGVAYLGKANQAQVSVPGGMYKTGDVFSVELTAEPGARIYYTLDCTDPTQSSTPYTGPIQVSGTTILRTRVYMDNYLESFMDTQSYLYDVNNGGYAFVVSLVSDPDNLVSEEKGIMIKGPNASSEPPHVGANFWQDWEHEAHVEVFGGSGETLLSSGCGIKLHGQYSRAEKQQAFKVIARTKYGANRFPIALFSDRDYTEYQSFVLRSSGQDTDKTRLRDSILSELAVNKTVMYMETEIGVLYLDGKYWGHYNLRERINTASICQFEGWEGDEDVVDLIKANDNVMQGSNATFAELLAWVKETNPKDEGFYEKLGTYIDIQNYIEYMAVQIFTGNTDTLNVKRYRNGNADGKWRWVLFDLDWAFYTDTNSINRWLTPGGMGNGLRTDNTLFIACMKNPRFRDEFLTHMGQEMATTFSTENVLRLTQERYEELNPLMPDQLARWEISESQYANEMQSFITYAKERPKKLMEYFAATEYLKMSNEDMVKYFGAARDAALAYENQN